LDAIKAAELRKQQRAAKGSVSVHSTVTAELAELLAEEEERNAALSGGRRNKTVLMSLTSTSMEALRSSGSSVWCELHLRSRAKSMCIILKSDLISC